MKELEINWRQQTIQSLNQHDYGEPNTAPTQMVRRCLELCRLPLKDFTVEDLRLMIGQKFSFRYLVPLAIEHLRKDIFVEGNLYEGDLLENVLKIDLSFWSNNKQLWTEIAGLIKDRRTELNERGIATLLFDSAF